MNSGSLNAMACTRSSESLTRNKRRQDKPGRQGLHHPPAQDAEQDDVQAEQGCVEEARAAQRIEPEQCRSRPAAAEKAGGKWVTGPLLASQASR